MIWATDLMKRFHPWGFEGLSLFAVMRFFVEGVQKGALSTRSAAISFRLFVAVFPTLIVLFSLLPMFNHVWEDANLTDVLLQNIAGYLPGDTDELLRQTIDELFEQKHNTILSFGGILLVYYASNSVNAILQGFNGSYNIEKRGNMFFVRAASVVLMIILSFLLILALSLILFSGMVLEYLVSIDLLPTGGVVTLLEIARWLITIFLIYICISTLYNAGDLKRKRWKIFSAGATSATFFFIVASVAFAWFVNNFARFDALYGTLGTTLVLLIWMNFVSTILLLGFELNASISRAKRSNEERLLAQST